jgi:hypothetical protein
MQHIYIPTNSAEDWQALLAKPGEQWKKGHSARALAHCWEDADGFPPEIAALFAESDVRAFENVELLAAFPEHKVFLPGGNSPSQNDIFAVAEAGDGQLISITIEGKVSESFGDKIEGWTAVESEGRSERLEFLKNQLGLSEDFPPQIRYQRIHRFVSAVIEARRFNAPRAAMIVHSFSQDDEGFDDYREFLSFFGAEGAVDKLVFARETQGIDIYAGWARGAPKYLTV